jgi:uroporphyrin-III C-methyltransferase/precorrin-2 dehydrogenase/sirohydrochlorin ferrochelatase
VSRPVPHPICLDLAGEPVVVVGGGEVARRKVASLVESGARVTVIAPACAAALEPLVARGEIRWVPRAYAPGDLAGARLAYAATDDPEVNRAVHAEARARRVWLNVADQPELCDFTAPAVVRRGDLTIAVSTNGASPAMARWIRERLDAELGPEYAEALGLLRQVRERLRRDGLGTERARQVFQALAGPELVGALADRDDAAVDRLLGRILGPGWMRKRLADGAPTERGDPAETADAGCPATPAPGRVYLVGAGPGDPGLLTVKGKQCLEASDVVIYDALVDKRLLDHSRPGALLIYAGKREGHHSRPQEEINALLVQYARLGLTVTRLKGGDPFVFGRGGEEALALVEAGIPFEVVPGVSAGLAVPAYAGIPITHRHYAAAVTFVTGHERTDQDSSRVRWDELGSEHGTLVFFMGVRNLPEIAARLLENGRSPETPAAVIEWGTTEHQVTVTAPLADIARRAREAGIGPPALVVVGEVVSLRDRLQWFPEPWAAPRLGLSP